MPLPIKPGALFGVFKELKETTDKPVLVAGTLADQLAREFVAGGDPTAVRAGGEPKEVAAMLYVLGDDATEDDERMLKSAHRARVPTIVIAAGRPAPARIPSIGAR